MKSNIVHCNILHDEDASENARLYLMYSDISVICMTSLFTNSNVDVNCDKIFIELSLSFSGS